MTQLLRIEPQTTGPWLVHKYLGRQHVGLVEVTVPPHTSPQALREDLEAYRQAPVDAPVVAA